MSEQGNQIEFEIKAQVNDRTYLTTLLDAATYSGQLVSTDTYYDVASKDLFKSGVFVRVRDDRNLQIKFNPDTNDFTHTTSYEQNYDLPLTAEKSQTVKDFLETFLPIKQTEGRDIFSQFGLEEFVEVKKKRETFHAEGVTICLDDVDGLGLFVEIEAIDPRKTSFVKEYSEQAGLTNIKIGYVELLLRKRDFALYRQGRYLLDADRDGRLLAPGA